MLKINTVTMEDKINEILNKYLIHPKDHLKITDELLNLFNVSNCEHDYCRNCMQETKTVNTCEECEHEK